MKQVKRLLSVLLAVVMLIAVVPVGNVGITASAANGVKTKLDAFKQSYPSGSRWTGTFDGGSQCYGFGKMAIYNVFGKNSSGGYRSWTYAGVSTSGMTLIGSITSFSASSVQSLLSNARCGDILQFNTTKQHTMIVYAVNSSSVTIYDCNWDNNCGISLRDCSFGTWSGWNSTKLSLLRADNYDEVNGSSTPTTAPTVAPAQKVYAGGDTITLNYNAPGATSLHLYIYKDGVKWFEGEFPSSGSFSRECNATGHYAFYVVGHYSSGDISSLWDDFDVYERSSLVPSKPDLWTEKADYPASNSIAIYHWSEKASMYSVSIYKDGQIVTNQQPSTSSSNVVLSDPGNYKVVAQAINSFGGSDYSECYFSVYNSVPEEPSISIPKNTFTLGEVVQISLLPCAYSKDAFMTIRITETNEPVVGPGIQLGINCLSYEFQCDNIGCYTIEYATTNEYGSSIVATKTFNVVESSHSYDEGLVTKAATCTATGVRTYTCTVCGATKTETIAINSSNHVNTKNISATASTCTVKGYTAGVYCNDCKKYISGHQEQPLAAHTLTLINKKDATCTAAGYTGDQYCTVCKQTISKGTTIAKKAHTITVINKRDATYDAEGYTGDEYCTVCKQTIKSGTSIPKLTRPDAPSDPGTQDQPQQSGGGCKWCGQTHGGAFGWLTRIIHNILAAIFGARY